MPDLVALGTAIEGRKVGGSSREILVSRGLVEYNKQRCFRFVATRDVKAAIRAQLEADDRPTFEPNAGTDLSIELICNKAIVHSFDKKPKCDVRARTSTHQANFWDFHDRTAVKIDRAHEEMANALAKPKLLPRAR
jgi:hypothetical protein